MKLASFVGFSSFAVALFYFCTVTSVLPVPILDETGEKSPLVISTQSPPLETEVEVTTTIIIPITGEEREMEDETSSSSIIATIMENTLESSTSKPKEAKKNETIIVITKKSPKLIESNVSASLSAPIPFDEDKDDPCSLFPCGVRAVCEVRHGNRSCSCLKSYPAGNPEVKCREECNLNSDCPEGYACVERNIEKTIAGEKLQLRRSEVSTRQECVDICTVDPYEKCAAARKSEGNSILPCSSSNPCGENTRCEEKYGRAICHCLDGFYGDPWGISCVPECSKSSHCPADRTCMQMKCKNPCDDPICGEGAICQVNNQHSASCSCPEKYEGDPYKKCTPLLLVQDIVNDDGTTTVESIITTVIPSDKSYDY